MDDAELESLRKKITQLRRAIDRAKAEHEPLGELPFIRSWPKECCDAPYVPILLDQWGFKGVRHVWGDVSHYGEGFDKHVWFEVDGVTIDITADQFPGVADRVVVARNSPWHLSLRRIEHDQHRISDEEWLVEIYNERFRSLHIVLEEVLPQYAPFLADC